VLAGQELDTRVGVRVPSAPPPTGRGVNISTREREGVDAREGAGASIRPADDYIEILMPAPTERPNLRHATTLWKRTRHNGLGQGAPLIQEFRKEADAAAAHDAESKKKP
jgi:hypothetical protein